MTQDILNRVERLFGLADVIESRFAQAQRQVDTLMPSLANLFTKTQTMNRRSL